MNEATITNIIAELRDKLVGRKFGKIFVFGRESFAIDFRREDGAYLFVSATPTAPRLYLIRRRVKELNALSVNPGSFVNILRKTLTHAVLTNIEKVAGERVVQFIFESRDEAGLDSTYSLTVQLTGRSSNAFLIDSKNTILQTMRETFVKGQLPGDSYEIPQRPKGAKQQILAPHDQGDFDTLSESLDGHYTAEDSTRLFKSLADSARSLLKNEAKKVKRLKKKLEGDLKRHGEPEKWKRLGDLVNANISTAKRNGDSVELIDYFDDSLPTVTVEIDQNTTLSEAADKYFKKYSKARNARIEIKKRLDQITSTISKLSKREADLDVAIESGEEEQVAAFLPKRKKNTNPKSESKKLAVSKYARDYVSSDGLVILVGKRSKDNDYLTFRIARSLDIWLHAADYPGSHVVIRKKGREEIPQRTLLEAARLAAFYSKAKNESKAAVRYTERKFVNKPKGAAPGLVSLASSKTILVKPGVPEFEKND